MSESLTTKTVEQAVLSYLEAVDSGERPTPEEWLARYPELSTELAAFFADGEKLDTWVGKLRGTGITPLSVEPEFRSFGDYEILEVIAPGGMGVVYKARQKSADRIVALKVIRPDKLDGLSEEERRRVVERFQMEAQAAAQLEDDQGEQLKSGWNFSRTI